MVDVLNRETKQYLQSVNTPDYSIEEWIHAPDLTNVEGVSIRYWKIDGDVVSEMTQEEKDAVDADLEVLDEQGLPGKDYKYIRNQIIIVSNGIGFANLNQKQKKIASRWFAVSKSDRDTVYTTEEQIQLGLDFHNNSVKSREARFDNAMMEVYNRLSGNEINQVIADIAEADLEDKYIIFGREGTTEGDIEGLFDYIEARAGTSFENTGLAAKGYTPDGMTLSELVTRVMDILKNGNY